MAKILIIDDEEGIARQLAALVKEMGHAPTTVATGEAGLEVFRRESPDLVIVDIKLPGMDGLAALQEMRRIRPDVNAIVITAHGTLETAIDAVRLSSSDYLPKPFGLDAAEEAIRRALGRVRPSREIVDIRREIAGRYSLKSLVGKNPVMQEVFKTVAAVCESDTSVLIVGESGTGKELVAHAIHDNSRRAAAPFEAVNCAAIPETLLESELYGYEKGAFTGAAAAKAGKFEAADGGTVFLDEVSEMVPASQVKLLRFIEDRRVVRLGENKPVAVDVRVIAATNQDLEDLVRRGRFRQELYYRLNVVKIALPPLRRRMDDLPLLVAHFLERGGVSGSGITDGALEALKRYAWPGNVRELRNAVEHGLVLARGKPVDVGHLPPSVTSSESVARGGTSAKIGDLLREMIESGRAREGSMLKDVGEEWEKVLIDAVLAKTGGNQVRASALLGINRLTLRRKMKQYGLAPKNGE